ncbi:hypothetical protein PPYR_05520 [Photinus pyralis]|uniref:non-specific serine/threonine protein kinase n=1 Tax=Photinus pyralis TaxID=7054 RepID=A0A5N4AV15_PHOPY|nr:eukaryotic translation initiation factor 2-alpha kinase-like isoform X1 [Photinus pyralis]KAB0801166.1 hypothetical protein PPYR_05520 [Photinus pyralis]
MVSLNFPFLCLLICSLLSLSTQDIAQLPHCTEDNKQTELIFVSTLDGAFSALTSTGTLAWQIGTGPGSLLNSNIHQLELSNNGQWIRIIPSLSGSLYKFNGITVDPLPISADSLLTSSFRYLDDLAVAGGREVRTYGVALHTGQTLYECSLGGCHNTTEYTEDVLDVIIVERKTHTVRAVEPRTGVERWNFTVGQHNIKIPYLSCVNTNMKVTNINISAVLPEGLLSASHMEKPTNIIWQYKFDTPIVAIWRWDGREVTPLNLFSSPAVMVSKKKADTPSIYVGMHNKQLYIHESTSMKNILHLRQRGGDKDSVIESQSLAKIPWKPVPAVLEIDGIDNDTDDSTALSVLYGSEYVNGNGFYLYTDEKLVCGNNGTNSTIPPKVSQETIWDWWKEALVIIITLMFIFNMVFTYKLPRFYKHDNVVLPAPPSETDETAFTSRYMTEFDPIACLGKGGFGVVFHAKKKFDECEYAIKRITLPKRETAKDRMMREVKALAKLDHRNIVRYYNAWLESPPYGWQVEHDQRLLSDFSSYNSTSAPSRLFSTFAKNVESHCSFETGFFDEYNRNESVGDGSSIVFENSANTPTSKRSKESTVSKYNQRRDSNSCTVCISPIYLYIQMQLCCKQSLKEWLSTCSVRDRSQSLAIFGQIVEAVEYVHFRHLIHRDLKPSNIFFSLEGQIKVGDFGLVTSIKEYDADDDDDYSKLSLKKSYTNAVGTHLYMSPEQLNAQQYDSKVDIYSLGIILFELLVAFNTEMERVNVLSNVRQRKYPKEFTAKISKELPLLNSMLSSNPMERPTATGIRERLCLDDSNKMDDSRFNFNLPTSTFVNTLVN